MHTVLGGLRQKVVWQLGRVTGTKHSPYMNVRSVMVRTQGGILRRPVKTGETGVNRDNSRTRITHS